MEAPQAGPPPGPEALPFSNCQCRVQLDAVLSPSALSVPWPPDVILRTEFAIESSAYGGIAKD
eukprot:10627743-Karenia_brevis.AAC.1